MGFLKNVFGTKDSVKVIDHTSFWQWFVENEKSFFTIVKNNDQAEEKFVQKVVDKLHLLNNRFYCLAGMHDESTAELVITAEGDVKTMVFVEELVAAAPSVGGWKFTALKPAIGFEISIEMDGYEFSDQSISFFCTRQPAYPDEIDITLVHKDYNEKDETIIKNGCLIYIDNALGELNSVSLIDSLSVTAIAPTGTELISIHKLSEFLQWRQTEFLEKYQGTRHNTENDSYSTLEAEDQEGFPVLAILNQQLMDWDSKASHPWMLVVEIKYDGIDSNGMPDDETYKLMDEFEDKLMRQLPDMEGYLDLGRETHNNTRTIFFACKDFRKASKEAYLLIDEFADKLDASYEIYKDKYWMTMNRFK